MRNHRGILAWVVCISVLLSSSIAVAPQATAGGTELLRYLTEPVGRFLFTRTRRALSISDRFLNQSGRARYDSRLIARRSFQELEAKRLISRLQNKELHAYSAELETRVNRIRELARLEVMSGKDVNIEVLLQRLSHQELGRLSEVLPAEAGHVRFARVEPAIDYHKTSLLYSLQSSRASHMTKAHYQKVSLAGVDLRGVQYRSSWLSGGDLRQADLRLADLSRSRLPLTDLSGARLDFAILRKTDFRDARLADAVMVWADLRGGKLVGADLRGAKLNFSRLTGADLRGAQMTQADLSHADLSFTRLAGANLEGAALDGTILKGAIFDQYTQLPFSRGKALERGMRFVETL